jgi:hypothetical protein
MKSRLESGGGGHQESGRARGGIDATRPGRATAGDASRAARPSPVARSARPHTGPGPLLPCVCVRGRADRLSRRSSALVVLHTPDHAVDPCRSLDLVLGVCLGQTPAAQVQVLAEPFLEASEKTTNEVDSPHGARSPQWDSGLVGLLRVRAPLGTMQPETEPLPAEAPGTLHVALPDGRLDAGHDVFRPDIPLARRAVTGP